MAAEDGLVELERLTGVAAEVQVGGGLDGHVCSSMDKPGLASSITVSAV
jgi:hypothetical protein